MTRENAEKRIFELMLEIREVVREYAPNDDYLTLTLMTPGYKHISFNNTGSFDNDFDQNQRIDFWADVE